MDSHWNGCRRHQRFNYLSIFLGHRKRHQLGHSVTKLSNRWFGLQMAWSPFNGYPLCS
ncbi:hypothetical protein FGIG_02132 [Fasciola gigantica]|uniref:Uncharacterized protein n=1 Tax=Fasciola gigantica TaxID=46835 RepID=A0A504YS72_FASGI|nr:hypothetical protein FGIG_02132 [Fasciola gigantica]